MALKFTTNIPQTLTIEFDEPKETSGQYGVQYMYTITAEGEKNWLYASPTLHTIFQNVGVQRGHTYVVTKIEIGTRNGWKIEEDGKILHDDKETTAKENPTPTTTTTTTANPVNNFRGKPTFADLAKLMGRCLKAGDYYWNDIPHEPAQIQSTAATLFIAAEQNGLWNEDKPAAKPAPPPEPKPEQKPEPKPDEGLPF